MRSVLALVSVLAVASVSFGQVLMMDAAEFDQHGNPLVGFAAVRLTIDNRPSPAPGVDGLFPDPPADVTNVRFSMNWTGNVTGFGYWASDDANSPWYGVIDPPHNEYNYQIVDGIGYRQGRVFYPQTLEWAPTYRIDPTPDDFANGDDYLTVGTVPGGLEWDFRTKLVGDDVKLFHSPAQGGVNADQLTAMLYDSDPLPQSVPEPGTLGLLIAGALIAWKRKRRRFRRVAGESV